MGNGSVLFRDAFAGRRVSYGRRNDRWALVKRVSVRTDRAMYRCARLDVQDDG